MIFQEPMTAFSPVHTIGNQIMEVVQEHEHRPDAEVQARAIELLERVGIAMPERRVKEYPFQLSGGMPPTGHDRHGLDDEAQAVDCR